MRGTNEVNKNWLKWWPILNIKSVANIIRRMKKKIITILMIKQVNFEFELKNKNQITYNQI